MFRKTTSSQPSLAIFLMVVVCLVVLFMPSVSAFDFDNTYEYFDKIDTAVIHNCDFWIGTCLNEGEILATVTRTTPHKVKAILGIDQLVGEFNFTTEGDFNDIFKDMYLTDMRNGNEISRGKQYKYKKYKEVSIDDYDWTDCKDVLINGSMIENCDLEEVGSHLETQMEWKPITNPNEVFYSDVTYEIGIFVDVEVNDWGDWKPKVLGVEIPEWAEWEQSYEVDIVSWWNMSDSSGTVVDFFENHNSISETAVTYEETGVQNNAIISDSTSGRISMGLETDFHRTGDRSFGGWFKTPQNTYKTLFGTFSRDAGGVYYGESIHIYLDTIGYRAGIGGTGAGGRQECDSGIDITDNAWHFAVISVDGLEMRFWLDGLNVCNKTLSQQPVYDGTLSTMEINGAQLSPFYGTEPTTYDELFYYSRTLSSSEIIAMYDSGTGTTPTSGTPDNPPIVTLHQPTNNTELKISTITFNATVSDDVNLANVTLNINGVANITNSSGFNNSVYTFQVTLGDDDWNYSITGVDNISQSTTSETRIFNVDTNFAPEVTLNSPIDNATIGADSVIFSFTPIDGRGFSNATLHLTNLSQSEYYSIDQIVEVEEYSYNSSNRTTSIAPFSKGTEDYMLSVDFITKVFDVINITDPTNLTSIGSLVNATCVQEGVAVSADGNFAFTNQYELKNFCVINITDPTNPNIIFSMHNDTNLNKGEKIYFLERWGQDWIVTGGEEYTNLINVTDVTAPSIYNFYTDAHTGWSDMIIIDDWMYVTKDDYGLEVINFTEPDNMNLIVEYARAGRHTEFILQNPSDENVLYIGNAAGGSPSNQIDYYNITNILSSLDLIGSYANATFLDSADNAVWGNNQTMLAVGENSGGLMLLDVSNSSTITPIAWKDINAQNKDVQYYKGYAYMTSWVGDSNPGITVIDVSSSDTGSEIIINNQSAIVNNTANTITLLNMTLASYSWYMEITDSDGLITTSGTEYFEAIDEAIIIELVSPSNAYTSTIPAVNFECNASEYRGVTELNLVLNGVVNQTVTNSTSLENLTISKSINLGEGSYTWSCNATNLDIETQSPSRSLDVEYPTPSVTLTTPANDSTSLIEETTFTFDATSGDGISNVNLIVDNVVVNSSTSGVNGSYTFVNAISSGEHNWTVHSYSILDKLGTTTPYDFVVHTIAPTVTITAPSGSLDYIILGDNETLNYSITEAGENLTEHLDECWYVYEDSVLSTFDGSFFGTGANYGEGWVYIEDKDTQQFSGVYTQDQGSAPWIRVHKDALSTTGDYQSLTLDMGWNQSTTWNMELNNNGWHYISYQFDNDGAFDTNWLDMFKVIGPTSYLQQNYTIECDSTTQEFEYILGANNITIFAKDEYGLIGNSTSSWGYIMVEDAWDYPGETLEGSTDDIRLNATITNSLRISTIKLIYDSVESTATYTNPTGNDYEIATSHTAPAVGTETNYTFYYKIIYEDDSYSTSSTQTQLVGPLGIDNCSNYTNMIFNFTVVDEATQTILSGAGDNVSVKVDLALSDASDTNEVISLTYFYNKENPAAICMEEPLGGATYSVTGVIEYSSSSRFVEFYNIDGYVLTEETDNQNITLYNLLESEGQEFKITYKGQDFIPVTNLLIQIQRKYIDEGVYKVIEIPMSGSNGYTVAHLVPNDVIYNLIFIKNGEILDTFNEVIANCQNPAITECEINLNALITGTNLLDLVTDDVFFSSLSYDRDTRTVSSTYGILSGVSDEVQLNITLNDNFGTNAVCSDSLFAAGGTLSCVVPESFGNSTIYAAITYDDVIRREGFISQNMSPKDQFGGILIFASIIMLMFIFGIGVSDNPAVTGIFLILGSILLVGLNLVYTTSIFGAGATMLWFVIAVLIVIIKGGSKR